MVDHIVKTTHYKLVLILDQLTPKEWRALKKFILMYTRLESDNFDLFNLLREKISTLNTNEDIKLLHKTHFPQMTSKTFFNMMSRLTKWVEDWMVYEDIRNSDQRDIRLIRLYNSRGLYKESNAVANKAIKAQKNKPGLSMIATENLAKIYYYQYFSNNPIKYHQPKLLNLMTKTTLETLKDKTMLLNNQHIFSTTLRMNKPSNDTFKLKKIIRLLPSTDKTKLLTSIENLLHNYDFKSLLEIKNDLENNKILHKSDLHIITTMYVYNSSPTLWAKNKFNNTQIIEDILNYAIESGVVLSDEKINPTLWHTMISIISTVRSYDESKSFINKWHTKVATRDFKSLHTLSMAQCCFHHEKYEKIRDYIYSIESIESEHKNRASSLIVISLFKERKKNYKLFIDFAHNFLRQLKRSKHKITNESYNGYANFTRSLLSIAQASFKESKIMIEDSRYIMYRSWLRKEIKKADTN